MEKQEFLEKITEIGTCEDDVKRRELLTSLSEDVSKDYDELTSLAESNATLTQERETLREANMKLFLRVGEDKDSSTVKENETGIKNEQIKKLSFNDLFDEKGGIK